MPVGYKSRFFEIVDNMTPDENGCKIWSSKGRPHVRMNGIDTRGSRLLLERKLGRPIKENYQANHTCDDRRCCSEEHIYEGTQQQNIKDMIDRGRFVRNLPKSWQMARGDRHGSRLHPEKLARGEANGKAKFTEEQVREIRQLTLSIRQIAKLYGVSRFCIRCIRERRTWRHVQ